MYSDWMSPVPYGAGLLAIWLTFLTFLIWQQGKFLKSLFPKKGERDIRKKFEEVLEQVGEVRQNLDKFKGNLSKVELLRYNPYDDTGGDQSFSVALLDDQGNGIVLTSLHARSGTRVFAKPILSGKGSKYHLSEEEQQVVDKAMYEK